MPRPAGDPIRLAYSATASARDGAAAFVSKDRVDDIFLEDRCDASNSKLTLQLEICFQLPALATQWTRGRIIVLALYSLDTLCGAELHRLG